MKKRYLCSSLFFFIVAILFYFFRNNYYDFYCRYGAFVYGLLVDLIILLMVLTFASDIRGLSLVTLFIQLASIYCLILSLFGYKTFLMVALGLNLVALIMIRIINRNKA